MQGEYRERKLRPQKRDSVNAFEIYQRTHFLSRPVLLWIPHACKGMIKGGKKEALYKSLKSKAAGLYFFTPGVLEGEIELTPLNRRVINNAEYSLKSLPNANRDFTKKFQDPAKWKDRCRKRLKFLKKVIASWEGYQSNNAKSLFLEETVYFAADNRHKPSCRINPASINGATSNMAQIILCRKHLRSALPREAAKIIANNPHVPAAFFHHYLFRAGIPRVC